MANASGNGSLTGRRGVQPAATGPAGGGGHPAISRNMGMGNVNALVGVVLALAASRRRQTPHVAPTSANPTAPSRAAPRPLRPGFPVRRHGPTGGPAVRATAPPRPAPP